MYFGVGCEFHYTQDTTSYLAISASEVLGVQRSAGRAETFSSKSRVWSKRTRIFLETFLNMLEQLSRLHLVGGHVE